MKYILIWFVSQWVSTSCPDFVPNPYTGEYPNNRCLALHGRTVEVRMKREFNSMEELEEFKKGAPPECHGWISEVHDIPILDATTGKMTGTGKIIQSKDESWTPGNGGELSVVGGSGQQDQK